MDFPEKTTIHTIDIEIVPRYSETDQGGIVHNSVYPVYFEMGRTELMRANGIAYKDLEEAGYAMVIIELKVQYRRPAVYDEKLVLTTTCGEVKRAKLTHNYRLWQPDTNITYTEGHTTLACIDKNGKPQRIPKFMYPEDK